MDRLKLENLSFARVLSVLTTPAIVGSLILLYALYSLSPSTEIFLKSFALVFVLSILIPIFFIFYLVKLKKIGNFHIKNRKERRLPFIFVLIMSALSLLAVKYMGVGQELLRMLLIFYLMGLGYTVITLLKTKISGHVFVFTAGILLLTSYIDLRFVFLLPLAGVIGWSRVHLEQHSLGEVAGGFAYAIISFFVFSLLINS